MKDILEFSVTLVELVLAISAFVGFVMYLELDELRQFGWRGVCARWAVFIHGWFLMPIVVFHRMPWTVLRYHPAPVPSLGTSVGILILLVGGNYLLVSGRAGRWLMKPAVSRLLFIGVGLTLIAMGAGLKGWF